MRDEAPLIRMFLDPKICVYYKMARKEVGELTSVASIFPLHDLLSGQLAEEVDGGYVDGSAEALQRT